MSSFSPNAWTLDPPDRPDDLAGAVLHSLGRRIPKAKPWGVVKSFVVGALTFGLGPLVVWPVRFREYAAAEQLQFWHLAEWYRLRSHDPQAKRLQQSLDDLRPVAATWLIPLAAAGFLLVRLFYWLSQPWVSLSDIVNATYCYHPHGQGLPWFQSDAVVRQVHQAWMLCLCIGYGFHWLQVRQHVAAVGRFVRAFNGMTRREGIAPVAPPPVRLGISPVWVIAGVIGTIAGGGAYWAIPAAMAASVQARYINSTSYLTRGALAASVRGLLMNERPPIDVPLPAALRKRCANTLCQTTLPQDAKFCPRCGTGAPDERG